MILKWKVFNLRTNSVKNTFVLIGSTAVAQIIPLIFYPIISRLFLPSDFGLLAIVTSIATFIGVIATGKYDAVILLMKSKRAAANMVWLCLIASSVILAFFEIVFILFAKPISELLNEPALTFWVYFAPLMAFLIIIYQSYNEWCVRNGYFKNLSLNKIINAGSITFFKTFFGWISVNSGLIIGDLLGRFISAIACIRHAVIRDKEYFFKPSIRQIKFLAKKYVDCPKYIMFSELLNNLGGNLPFFLIGAFFGSTEVGYYTMATMVLSLPASVISFSIRDIFRQKANSVYNETGNCRKIYVKTLFTLSVISFTGFSVLFLIAPQLFGFVLGSQWVMAGKYAQILCPIVAISFVTEVGFSVFVIAEKMKEILWWQLTYLLLSILSFLVGIFIFKNIILTLICFTIGRSLVHLIGAFMSWRFAKGNCKNAAE